MNHLWLVILAMGLVTYLPRMLPMVLLQNMHLNPFLRRFFQFIPYAALSALIFPGVLSSTGSTPSAMAGALAAVILAFLRTNITFVVLGGIAGVLFWKVFIGI